jgi:hypothetical protein
VIRTVTLVGGFALTVIAAVGPVGAGVSDDDRAVLLGAMLDLADRLNGRSVEMCSLCDNDVGDVRLSSIKPSRRADEHNWR